CRVDYHDPYIPYLDIGAIKLNSVKLTAENLASYHCVIIATDHTSVDYTLIARHAQLIYDTRNIYAGVQDKKIARI
ncbi:MAG: UDP-N-acetyl-D-glucosamine dehydrogenase, partial [Candidatus Omnitrophica bacterium]|nr:UDP-N-acetyl-D-glucosamine dehydrogenase [Candidatus Omnitrophota bacterium]